MPKDTVTTIKNRPPVVSVLGHVDHGKTSLLDKIRSANVAARESGGITQAIGAYQIDFNGRQITFIDTPGHAAFEAMRSRGAQASDVALLVVAANDGVKPQTIEAIKHINNSGAKMIVVLNKIDLPNLNIEKVLGELTKAGVELDKNGGDVPVVQVSATTGLGINDLLDMIILVSDMVDLIDTSSEPFSAVVIESEMTKNKGVVTHAIVKSGILKTGQDIFVGDKTSKIRSITSDKGAILKEAGPSTPVEITGLSFVPDTGALITNVSVGSQEEGTEDNQPVAVSAGDLIAAGQAKKDSFLIIVKADVSGSLEAIIKNIPNKVQVLFSATGDVTSNDVTLSKSAIAPILAFNVKVPADVEKSASREGVIIKPYKIIYELLDDIDDVVAAIEAEKEEEKIKAVAEITAEFTIEGVRIAGVKVTKGSLKNGMNLFLSRNGQVLTEAKVASLKQRSKEVNDVRAGQECGVLLSPPLDFKIGDKLEFISE